SKCDEEELRRCFLRSVMRDPKNKKNDGDWPELPELPSFTIQAADAFPSLEGTEDVDGSERVPGVPMRLEGRLVRPRRGLSPLAPELLPGGEGVLERHAGTGLVRHDVSLSESLIDPDATKVVRRLERSGFEAYLVGGCVRDLLLSGRPKDFDVATSARPED